VRPWLTLPLGLSLFAAATLSYGAEATREQIQAAYLYRFLDFVEWPSTAPVESAAFCICVLGDERLTRALESSVDGKSILGRRVVARQLTDVREAKPCHLLFLTGRRQTVAAQVLVLQKEPVLTVSDVPGFQNDGGMVTFYFKGDRMQFDNNVENAKRQGILISSRLIQLSRSLK
jgi:YfiR/HmsC-like